MKSVKFSSLEMRKIKDLFEQKLEGLIDDFVDNLKVFEKRKNEDEIIKELLDFSEGLNYSSDFYNFKAINKLSDLLVKIMKEIDEHKIVVTEQVLELLNDTALYIKEISKVSLEKRKDAKIEKLQKQVKEILEFARELKSKEDVKLSDKKSLQHNYQDILTNVKNFYNYHSSALKLVKDNLWKLQKKKNWYKKFNDNLDKSFESFIDIQKNINKINEKKISDIKETLIFKNRKYALDFKKHINIRISDNNVKVNQINFEILENILDELIKNSIEHSFIRKEDSKILSEEFEIKVDIKKIDTVVKIYYLDNGRGFEIEEIIKKAKLQKIISEEEINNIDNIIFNILLMGKSFSTSKESGKGYGLKKVGKLIKKIDGKIIIDTNYKKGTKIIIEFPDGKLVV